MTIPVRIPDPLDPDKLLEDEFAKADSVVRIRIDTRRYGKKMTVLEGFDPKVDLHALAKELKHELGTGGTSKDGMVELQGDQQRAVRAALERRGFTIA